MESVGFHDDNVFRFVDSRSVLLRHDHNFRLQMHSSLVRKLSLETTFEGHQGCVNAVAWNLEGSLMISGSDDTTIKIWSYSSQKLLHSIDTGHSSNIFCTKFIPQTGDELFASGAADAEVRIFRLSRLSGRGIDETTITPAALFQCHTNRVKKISVEVGNPNVVWSASEDGTLRQHDFRECSSCPPSGSSHQTCRNVLLDLRRGSKKSLADTPKYTLGLKSCDISSTRPHLLLVGGSDAFARLYDRRMLPQLSSCWKTMRPPPCVNYFCPMHLSERQRSSLHLTHVTFSPNGEEVLLSYSGEHIYLMDVNCATVSAMQYSSGGVTRPANHSPVLNGIELQPPISCGNPIRSNIASPYAILQIPKCRKLVQIAEKSLEDMNYFSGIEACNEVLDFHGDMIEPRLRHDCLCIRAFLLLKRNWKNDVHMAIRDCNMAKKLDTSSYMALYYMSEALSQLGKHKQALEFAVAAQCLAPSNLEMLQRVDDVKKCLASAEAQRTKKPDDGSAKSEFRFRRILSLSDFLNRSEAHGDGQGSERGDSDYDEELELNFETLMSGDEGHEVDSNILHGSFNLRINRRDDSFKEIGGVNDSCGSPSSSSQNDECCQGERVIDMKQRFVGHCNVGTDIKQASFLGQKGEFVGSGSDDGRWFIWEKKTGRLIKILRGDETVVNCVQCHPLDCAVATSGIDSTIKLWTPTASAPSIVCDEYHGPETNYVTSVVESNQRNLIRNPDAILPFEIFEQFQANECAQS